MYSECAKASRKINNAHVLDSINNKRVKPKRFWNILNSNYNIQLFDLLLTVFF